MIDTGLIGLEGVSISCFRRNMELLVLEPFSGLRSVHTPIFEPLISAC